MTKHFPVYKNAFKIAADGATGTDLVPIASMDNFSVAIDGNLVEWSPLEAEGWMRRVVTGKDLKITVSGKRCVGDTGNDYIAGMAYSLLDDCNSVFEWTLPSGATVKFNCVINLTSGGGGESRDLEPLEFEVLCDGKPTYTPSAS